jgi:hypothetical protein
MPRNNITEDFEALKLHFQIDRQSVQTSAQSLFHRRAIISVSNSGFRCITKMNDVTLFVAASYVKGLRREFRAKLHSDQ